MAQRGVFCDYGGASRQCILEKVQIRFVAICGRLCTRVRLRLEYLKGDGYQTEVLGHMMRVSLVVAFMFGLGATKESMLA